MLDKFKEEQALFYEEVDNIIKSKKISHAYLIETNKYIKADELIIEFVKELFTLYVDKDEIDNINNLIDNMAFSDFFIVEPEGTGIKKEQILDLQEKLMTKSTEDRPRIYIIKEADKLNKYAANSLLKFLEEPEGNMIAILVTDNRYKVLETIRSRCQIYSLYNVNRNESIENIEEVINIIKVFEEDKKEAIAYLPVALENDYRNKDYWVDIFSSMIIIYENAIRKRENIDSFEDYEILDEINKNNDLDKIIHKIDVLFDIVNKLQFNLNVSMMLDKFIIDFNRGD